MRFVYFYFTRECYSPVRSLIHGSSLLSVTTSSVFSLSCYTVYCFWLKSLLYLFKEVRGNSRLFISPEFPTHPKYTYLSSSFRILSAVPPILFTVSDPLSLDFHLTKPISPHKLFRWFHADLSNQLRLERSLFVDHLHTSYWIRYPQTEWTVD